jgi:hypothetical protein
VTLPSGRYFLPEKAENVSCNDPKSCSRNVIEFRNYHKYVGESSISFDVPESTSVEEGPGSQEPVKAVPAEPPENKPKEPEAR